MKQYLSIDIGGTNIKYALLDTAGNIVEKDKVSTPTADLQTFMKAIYQIVEQYKDRVKGIAFSAPGKIDVHTKTIYYGGALQFLHKACMKELIEDRYNIPVGIENDGKAAALAEMWLGNLKDVDNCAAVVLGTGVGGGIIVSGHLVRGTHFQAGELSFLLNGTDQDGKIAMEGSLGSAVQMITRVNKALGNSNLKDGLAAFEAINAKQGQAWEIFESYCREIAMIIFNIQAVIDLQKFAIGGGISAQPIVVKTINEQYLKLKSELGMFTEVLTSPQIVQAHFQNDANLYGVLYGLLLQLNGEQ